MRHVVGKEVVELGRAAFEDYLSPYRGVVLDLGTGDGKHAYHTARQRPDQLVIGLDAVRENMRGMATKASGRPRKGGLPNLLYVWASAEELPDELRGITELHVLMPWGSLLRGMLGSDRTMLRGIAEACTPDADFLIVLNLHAWRPPVPEVGGHSEPTPESASERLAPIYEAAGWRLERAHYLDGEGIRSLATSWTRRLQSSRRWFDALALTGTITPGAGSAA